MAGGTSALGCPDDVRERLLRGRRLLHEGDLAAAGWEVRQARHSVVRHQGPRSSSFGLATLALGRVVAEQGDWDEALLLGRRALCLLYTRALAESFAFADALALVGLALARTGEPEQAHRYLDHSSAIARLLDEASPFTLRVDRELGDVLLALGRCDEASDALGRVWYHLYEAEDALSDELWEVGHRLVRALVGARSFDAMPEVVLRLVDDCRGRREVWPLLLEVVRAYGAAGMSREGSRLLCAAACLAEDIPA